MIIKKGRRIYIEDNSNLGSDRAAGILYPFAAKDVIDSFHQFCTDKGLVHIYREVKNEGASGAFGQSNPPHLITHQGAAIVR